MEHARPARQGLTSLSALRLKLGIKCKLSIPGDISLLFLDGDPGFKWMEPALSYLEVDRGASIRHAVRWVNRFAKGKDDRRKISTKAKLIEGGTIGPARR